jgi:hypothetical protein
MIVDKKSGATAVIPKTTILDLEERQRHFHLQMHQLLFLASVPDSREPQLRHQF